MARRTTALLFGITGQTIPMRFPPGRPTSATYKALRAFIELDDNSQPEFTGTAAVDTVNTTTTAAAGPAQTDPQLLTLASNTSLVAGKKYLLSANSVQEWVDLVEIASGYVRTRYPLQYDYPSGATLVSTWLTAAVDNTWIVDPSKISDLSDTFPDYRIRWDIVFGGATSVLYTFFDVVRAQVRNHVEIDDINARAPGLDDNLPIEYRAEDGRPLIDAGWSAVRAHLQALNIQVDAIREDEVLDELTILRSLVVLAEGGWKPPGWQDSQMSYVLLVTGNYNRFLEQHFDASLKHRVDYQLGPLNRTNALPNLNHPFWGK